jgi:hypothetical protein
MQPLNVVPVMLVLLPACVSQPPTATDRLPLGFAQSRLVRADQVERYRCAEGLLVVEHVSSGFRKITCGRGSTAVLLR